VFQFHDTMVDYLEKESKEGNQSLMLLMKECVYPFARTNGGGKLVHV
jgi:hypothetical protein